MPSLFIAFVVSVGLLAFANLVLAGADYYKILGISKTASSADIKRAYRKLSLKYHPDKNPSEDAAAKFAEIATAYDVLSDEDKRRAYDRGGEEAVKMEEQRQNAPATDPFDIFSHFGFGGMGGRHHHEEPRTPDVDIPLRVTLRQLYLGEILDVSYTRQVMCVEANVCQKNNNECQGPGVRVRMQQLAPGFVQQVQVHDSSCVARGKAWKQGCKACPKGMTEEEEIQFVVDVQAGMGDGDVIKFDQVADEAVGHIPGDLKIHIKQIPHEFFVRNGNNLHMSMTISLAEALIGFKKTIKHLDGREVVIEKKSVSYCSEIFVVQNEGMPKRGNPKSKGDLLITLSIDFPSALNQNQKDLIRKALNA